MFASFFRPNNLSQKVLRIIFSIYLVVSCLVTSLQFLTEYLKTEKSILIELAQLEQTVRGPISTSLWQFNQQQLEEIVVALVETPIIVGVDIIDRHAENVISKRAYTRDSAPLSIFETRSDLSWTLNEQKIALGSLILYSSSDVVLDRVLFGFALIVITAIIKLSVLFALFVWVFDRFLAMPLRELMSQVDEVQLDRALSKRVDLSIIEHNELGQLQDHMNEMLSVMARDRARLLEDEKSKRDWLEQAVIKRTKELEILNEKLKNLAAKDSLTGIFNRGSFFGSAEHLLDLSKRQKTTASFVVMDIDYFKMINDTYGHYIGDKVLIDFTRMISSLLRKSDVFGRIGGEEFAVLLPDTGIEGAVQIANKLRKTVGESSIVVEGKTITYTLSLGVASSGPDDNSIDELFKRADLKLYEAKRKGRDRVES